MGPFGLAYARLVEHGYAVLPIMPGTKKPGLPRNNNGGWMDFPGWTTFQPTLVHLKHWALSSAGIGVLCGPRSGYLIVIDIDTNDSGILAALCKILPVTPVKKKGARGESWFYYAPGVSSHSWVINGRKVVEILGDGRQTVLPPTIHPDLGEPYRWTGSKTLEELRPEDLPLLPPDIIEQIDAVLAPFGYVPPASQSRRGEHNGECASCDASLLDASDAPHRQLNEDALANLAAWVPALDLYNCRPYRQGYEAVPKWRPSSTGRDVRLRNRNLKITPNGIRDFGDNKGYTAIDLVMAAQECDLETAFNFLDEQLRWSGEGDGAPLLLDISGLTLAPDSEPSSPSSKPNGKGNGGGDSIERDVNGTGTPDGAQVIPLFKPAASARGPSINSGGDSGGDSGGGGSGGGGSGSGPPAGDPAGDPDRDLEPLTYVPGLVGDIVNWIVANARRPNRLLALAAALIVVATLIGRRCMGPTGNATHLYSMIITPASGGQEWLQEVITMLLEAAGAGSHVHSGEIASQGGLDDTLLTMPVGVIVIDEIHNFLGRLVSPKAGAWERSLIGQFNKLWGKNFGRHETVAKVGKPSKIVRSPALSLFGASTPGDFWPLLQGTEVSNGFFSRLLVFESLIRPKMLIPPLPVTVPAALKDDLAELYRFGCGPLEMAQLNDPNIELTPHVSLGPTPGGARPSGSSMTGSITGLANRNISGGYPSRQCG
jgi:hypothetical protein